MSVCIKIKIKCIPWLLFFDLHFVVQLLQPFLLKLRTSYLIMIFLSSNNWNGSNNNTDRNGDTYLPGSTLAATSRAWQSFRFLCSPAFFFSSSLNCSSRSATLCYNKTRTLAKIQGDSDNISKYILYMYIEFQLTRQVTCIVYPVNAEEFISKRTFMSQTKVACCVTIQQMEHERCSFHLWVCEFFLQLFICGHQVLILLFKLCLLSVPGRDPLEMCNIHRKENVASIYIVSICKVKCVSPLMNFRSHIFSVRQKVKKKNAAPWGWLSVTKNKNWLTNIKLYLLWV